MDACESKGLQAKYYDDLHQFLDNFTQVYGGLGLCLSEKPDMLSQWRGYADDAHGFCIGFNTAKLLGVVRSQFMSTLLCVEYDTEEQIKKLDRVATIVTNIVNEGAFDARHARIEGAELSPERHQAIARARFNLHRTAQEFSFHLYTMKNDAFREEEEWRIFSSILNKDDDRAEELSFAFRRDRIFPFKEIKIFDATDLFDEIYVGPRNITPREVIENFVFNSFKVKAKVKKSKATYR